MNRRTALTLIAAGASLTACGQDAGPRSSSVGGGKSVLGIARANGLDRFVRAVDGAGLTEPLEGAGPFTVFAPTDRAFAASNAGRLDGEALQRLVAYHVVPGQLTNDFLESMDVNHTTLLGSSLNVDGSGAALRVNGAAVVRADLVASNGVVFVIDRVLEPR